MILVCGARGDEVVGLVCARLDDLGSPYVFLDEAQLGSGVDLTWEIDASGVRGHLESPDWQVDLTDLTGVYTRCAGYRGGTAPAALSERDRRLVDSEHQLALARLLDLLPCVVVNRDHASASNHSKVYQAFLARSFGFETPGTLVTTDPDEARAFYAACGRRVIYKSLSAVRSIVRRLSEDDLGERIERVRNCPTQFQEYVEGVDVRVHTVGDVVYATEIVSSADDYRYPGRAGGEPTMRATTVPPAVADACLGLARSLGLAVAGVDLRRTADGRYYCFEVNPSPAFSFYERATGQPISRSVAELLTDGPAGRAGGRAPHERQRAERG